jgi:hypothetical protein
MIRIYKTKLESVTESFREFCGFIDEVVSDAKTIVTNNTKKI